MKNSHTPKKALTQAERHGIARLSVSGFKSISQEQSVDISPLTLLAGANSSGKSSIMQPLLLLKQTLESPYDPGPLLLHGPNLKFSSADQLLSRIGKKESTDIMHIGLELTSGEQLKISFRKQHTHGFTIDQMGSCGSLGDLQIWPDMTPEEIFDLKIFSDQGIKKRGSRELPRMEVQRERCFLKAAFFAGGSGATLCLSRALTYGCENLIPEIIHLSGWRGNPERTYSVAAVGESFPGTFEKYMASIIAAWSNENRTKLAQLNGDLKHLGLASGVWTRRLGDIEIELHVGRLPHLAPTRPEDRVNVADVGIGVSQTLPVLVALHAAKPGQLVYIEQPESHLHPRAQTALAEILAAAAKRGVHVVAETHSSLLLLGVQTLVAEGKLAPDLVKLHWFQRDRHGRTTIRSGELDEAGRFGDWPGDFDEVTLETERKFLDAAEKHLFAQ